MTFYLLIPYLQDSVKLMLSGVPELPLDDGLPSTVTVLDAPHGGRVYLVGTAHFSLQSQDDVSRVRSFYCIPVITF